MIHVCVLCRIRTAIAGGLCALCCAGGVAAASPPHHVRPHLVAIEISATPEDHAESPHAPETEATEPPRHEMAIEIRAPFTLDDPVLGRLDMNPLA